MPANHVRDHSPVALLILDVVNHFEFPDGERLLRQALAMAPRLARLKERVRAAGIPVLYVNDNFGAWRSNADCLMEQCLTQEALGRRFVEQLRPDSEDYFVLKPMHSGFYQTPLELLLRHLGAKVLLLAGLATNSCVLVTAQEAAMRDYRIVVVADCCAARTAKEHRESLALMAGLNQATIAQSAGLRLRSLLRRRRPAS